MPVSSRVNCFGSNLWRHAELTHSERFTGLVAHGYADRTELGFAEMNLALKLQTGELANWCIWEADARRSFLKTGAGVVSLNAFPITVGHEKKQASDVARWDRARSLSRPWHRHQRRRRQPTRPRSSGSAASVT